MYDYKFFRMWEHEFDREENQLVDLAKKGWRVVSFTPSSKPHDTPIRVLMERRRAVGNLE